MYGVEKPITVVRNSLKKMKLHWNNIRGNKQADILKPISYGREMNCLLYKKRNYLHVNIETRSTIVMWPTFQSVVNTVILPRVIQQ